MILVVDDERYITECISELLSDEKIFVIKTNKSEEAIDLINKHQITCVLTDIAMPFMNGVELGKKIRSLHPNIIMICISAYSESFEQDLIAVGFDHILPKPLNFEEMINTVKRYL
ncbi:MAG: response regulator [Bacteriovoracaceae bacterium]